MLSGAQHLPCRVWILDRKAASTAALCAMRASIKILRWCCSARKRNCCHVSLAHSRVYKCVCARGGRALGNETPQLIYICRVKIPETAPRRMLLALPEMMNGVNGIPVSSSNILMLTTFSLARSRSAARVYTVMGHLACAKKQKPDIRPDKYIFHLGWLRKSSSEIALCVPRTPSRREKE